MKKLTGFILLLTFFAQLNAQVIQRPKLVVGIVVDQMRWDFLYRYADRYTNDGFRRLLREGFSCENAFIPYIPTYTAAGHTCIYTGSVPALHGIVANNWYSRKEKKMVYCTDDDNIQTIGSCSLAGKMSPRNLWSSTITDELRLATNFRSKCIAIALKDRASIFPGGHSANAAYWFDTASGGWVTSTFYMSSLPEWVKEFNDRKLPETYLNQDWNTLYPLSSYVQSAPSANATKDMVTGAGYAFPHKTSSALSNRYEAFRNTPYGNSYTFEMAKSAIQEEELGKRSVTDFLALSFSSTDCIGHTFGPNSIEIEDTYLRFDRDLANFLKYLDVAFGKGQYLVFLTADHGVAHNIAFMNEHRIPSGNYDKAAIHHQLNESLEAKFKVKNLIEQSINQQIYLNNQAIAKNKLGKKAVIQFIIKALLEQPAIAYAVDLTNLSASQIPYRLKRSLANSYNPKLSGDIQVILKPQWVEGFKTGASHGTSNPYDTHIPLLWYGWHIKPGILNREVHMTDIAPTLAALLKIQMPNASIGEVIEEVVK